MIFHVLAGRAGEDVVGSDGAAERQRDEAKTPGYPEGQADGELRSEPQSEGSERGVSPADDRGPEASDAIQLEELRELRRDLRSRDVTLVRTLSRGLFAIGQFRFNVVFDIYRVTALLYRFDRFRSSNNFVTDVRSRSMKIDQVLERSRWSREVVDQLWVSD